MEEFIKIGRQDENLKDFYTKQIEDTQNDICEKENRWINLEKDINDLDLRINEADYEIAEAQDELRPYEKRYVQKLNEDTSILSSSLENTYYDRLSKLSKKVSPLTNGSLHSSKSTFKSSTISQKRSVKSQRSK